MAVAVAQQYSLGPVKPLTEQVAYIIGPMFGIKTIYGHRESDPFPDHPSGHALDFMIPSEAVGNALSAFAIANAKALGVDYIVWNRRSWNPRRGTWVPYNSTPNPHTDHVHITFLDKNDGTPLDQFVSGFTAGVTGGLTDLVDPLGIAKSNIINPNFWRRIGSGVLGSAFIIAGLIFIARRPIGQVAGAVGGAAGQLIGTAVQGASFGVGAGVTGGLGTKAVANKAVSGVPVTAPTRQGPRPPAINPPSNAPTTSALPPEIYAPVSSGGTYQVTAVGRAENPTEYRRPKGGSLMDIAGKRNPAPVPKKKVSKKGTHITSVSAPLREEPYGGK